MERFPLSSSISQGRIQVEEEKKTAYETSLMLSPACENLDCGEETGVEWFFSFFGGNLKEEVEWSGFFLVEMGGLMDRIVSPNRTLH